MIKCPNYQLVTEKTERGLTRTRKYCGNTSEDENPCCVLPYTRQMVQAIRNWDDCGGRENWNKLPIIIRKKKDKMNREIKVERREIVYNAYCPKCNSLFSYPNFLDAAQGYYSGKENVEVWRA